MSSNNKKNENETIQMRQSRFQANNIASSNALPDVSGIQHLPTRQASLRTEQSRLVARGLSYHQSPNKIQIEHIHTKKYKLWWLLAHNWFHVFLRKPTYISLTLLLTIWTIQILIFAGIYHAVDRNDPDVDCGLGNSELDPISWGASFAFSLETTTTVGYGLPGSRNAFFENCPELQFFIYCQMVCSMLMNAFLFAFLFTRLAKCENRAYQVVFAKECVVRLDRAHRRIILQVRVYDIDSRHPVVEAHIRLYALLKERDDGGHTQLVPLRVVYPNDELGSCLFTSVPTVVTHEIDCHSPLRPRESRYAQSQRLQTYGRYWRREVDAYVGSSDDIVCPICGESYGTHTRLRQHVKYNQIIERCDENMPTEGTHLELNADEDFPDPPLPSLQELREQFPLQELVCVLEGIDPLASGTFQALHSYRPEEIRWDCKFEPCLSSWEKGSRVDLDKFHEVVPAFSERTQEDSKED